MGAGTALRLRTVWNRPDVARGPLAHEAHMAAEDSNAAADLKLRMASVALGAGDHELAMQ